MQLLHELQPYLVVVMTIGLLCCVRCCMHDRRSHFANSNPWSTISATQFLSKFDSANQREGFSSLADRIEPALHGIDNFISAPIASKLAGALTGRGGFQGTNITEQVRASGAAAQLAAMRK